MSNKYFEKSMSFIFGSEGGYSNHPNDKGGRTNYGVTQATYNGWRRKKGLPIKDVKNISRDEAKQLYYEEFWVPSGASDLEDPRDAYILFDMAVNSSPSTAKKLFRESEGNAYKFLNNRKRFYNNIIKSDPTQKSFEQGWMNRLNDVEKNMNYMVDSGFYSPSYIKEGTPFDVGYSGELNVDKNMPELERSRLKNKYQYLKNKQNTPTGFATPISYEKDDVLSSKRVVFTPNQIGNMSRKEFDENESAIMTQLKQGQIKPNRFELDFSEYKNDKNKVLYTREDLDEMSTADYTQHETEITNQIKKQGIPYKNDVPDFVTTWQKQKDKVKRPNILNRRGRWINNNGRLTLM